ncbi:MAG: hypothetical protein M5U14_12665 [Acidimicrobiia bacterium]|nr:hypothetical protein [Acidimicrobiia bacterium]
MGDYVAKIAGRVSADLEPGERLLAAMKAMPRGAVKAIVYPAAGMANLGVAGAVAGSEIADRHAAEGRDEAEAVGVETNAQMITGLTDRRILLWKMGGLRAAPKHVLGELPRAQVASVTMGTAKVLGQTMAEVTVTTTDGAQLHLQVPRVQRREAERFVEAFGATPS